MEEAPENGKELTHSAWGSDMKSHDLSDKAGNTKSVVGRNVDKIEIK
jgi:hypothetical protein